METFHLPVSDLKLANTLRRIIFSEIPTYACDSVVIHQNGTIMTDEMIAFNLAWAPLQTLEPVEPGTVLEHAFSADFTNPGPGVRILRLKDLCNHKQDLVGFLSPQAVLAALQPGECIKFVVDVVFSSGSTHCKFCPAKKVAVCTKGCASPSRPTLRTISQDGRNAKVISKDAVERLVGTLEQTLSKIDVTLEL